MTMQIFVLGMHRSGTSLLTRLMNLAGAYVGGEGDTTDAAGISEENPKGFWERTDVRAANEALLDAVGCDWERVSRWAGATPSGRARDVFAQQARNIIVKLDAHRPWVVKDPRLCLTYSRWKPLLEQPMVLLPLRDPREVAISLEKRNEFPQELGLALWEYYVLAALKSSSDAPRLLVHHAELLRDPVATLAKMLEQIQTLADVDGLRLPRRAAIEAFVDARLHRAVAHRIGALYDDHPALSLHATLVAKQIPLDLPPLSERSRNVLARHEDVLAKRLHRRLESGGVDGPQKMPHPSAAEREVRLAGMLARARLESSRLRNAARQAQADAEALQRVHLEKQDLLRQELLLRGDALRQREQELQHVTQRLEASAQGQDALWREGQVLADRLAQADSNIARLLQDGEKTRSDLARSEQLHSMLRVELEVKASDADALARNSDGLMVEIAALRTQLAAAEESKAEAVLLLESHNDLKRSHVKHKQALARARERIGANDDATDLLRRRLSEIERLLDTHLRSMRWRAGNAFVRIIERLILRSRPQLASDVLKERLAVVVGSLRSSRPPHAPAYKGESLPSPVMATAPTMQDGDTGTPSIRTEARPVSPLFDTTTEPVTVVVPVYNAVEATRRCLESVIAHTRGHWRLLVIDDASSDAAVTDVLEQVRAQALLKGVQAEILRNPQNLGFVQTVNRAFTHVHGDVVILNSDTSVPPGWLARLAYTASASHTTATVTPLSNNAGPFSVPQPGVANDYPQGLDLAHMNRLVRQAAAGERIDLPTGHGFCMYIRRRALDSIGGFDATHFPRGYGEENDFCMRAAKAGFENLVDDRVFIHHERSASFGEEKSELLARNRKTLDLLHPDYTSKVRRAFDGEGFAAIGNRIAERMKKGLLRPRILFVIHAGGGGTTQTNLDLMRELHDYECLLLEGSVQRIVLKRLARDGSLELLREFPLETRWQIREPRRADYSQIYQAVLIEYAIDLVHVRHMIAHSLDLVDVLAALDIPMVLSLHDFYLLCPTIQLIDGGNRYCRGRCHRQTTQCSYSKSWLGEQARPLSHWNEEWRNITSQVVDAAFHLVTTTQSARTTLMESMDAARGKPFSVIEHGRDFTDSPPLRAAPQRGKPVRILVPGQLGNCKGTELLRRIKASDKNDLIEFHFLGKGSEALSDIGVVHGEYHREDFHGRVRAIRPSLSAILSIWPETYCHTLSESWAAGVPVVASRIGALEERVSREGGGWLVDVDDAAMFITVIEHILSSPEEYLEVAAQVDGIHMPSTSSMADEYRKIYTERIFSISFG